MVLAAEPHAGESSAAHTSLVVSIRVVRPGLRVSWLRFNLLCSVCRALIRHFIASLRRSTVGYVHPGHEGRSQLHQAHERWIVGARTLSGRVRRRAMIRDAVWVPAAKLKDRGIAEAGGDRWFSAGHEWLAAAVHPEACSPRGDDRGCAMLYCLPVAFPAPGMESPACVSRGTVLYVGVAGRAEECWFDHPLARGCTCGSRDRMMRRGRSVLKTSVRSLGRTALIAVVAGTKLSLHLHYSGVVAKHLSG